MSERRKLILREPEDPGQNQPHLREVGGADHVPNVSLTLRVARQRAGYDIKDVAETLRIRVAHLEAIEAGRFGDLPGPTYVTGFLRSYAEFLGLDAEEIIGRYREEIGAASRQKLSFPVPSYEGRVPRVWLILVALVLVGLAYAGWHYYSTRHESARETVAEPPVETGEAPTAATGPATADDTSSAPAKAASSAAPAKSEAAAPSGSTGTVAPATSVGRSLFQNNGAAPTGTSSDATSPAPSSPPSPASSTPQKAPETGSKPAGATGGSRTLWKEGGAPATTSAPAATATASAGATTNAAGAAPAEDEDFSATDAPSAATNSEPVTAKPADAEPAEAAASSAQASGAVTVQTVPPPTEADVAALENDGDEVAVDGPTAASPVAASTAARIVIGARADSWLQIQGPGNELVMTRILRAGETYPVPERQGLVMVTGNAGGIEIMVDGQPIAPLGPMGVVKRNIVLDPDALRATFGAANQ